MKYARNKWILIIGLVPALLWLSKYVTRNRTYSFEEMSAFLATCGSFVQAGFQNEKPGQWDYFIVFISVLVVLVTLYYSIKYLVRPDEKNSHIKYQIFENEKKR